MIPLLQNPLTILENNLKSEKVNFFTSPMFVFSLLFIIIIIISSVFRDIKCNRILDIILFSCFSILAIMMIFFNFLTDHQQMKLNFNIIWLNPFIILCLVSLIFRKNRSLWFRIVFFLNIIWFLILLIFPHSSNTAFMPFLLIIIIRSSARAGFQWNPLTIAKE